MAFGDGICVLMPPWAQGTCSPLQLPEPFISLQRAWGRLPVEPCLPPGEATPSSWRAGIIIALYLVVSTSPKHTKNLLCLTQEITCFEKRKHLAQLCLQ